MCSAGKQFRNLGGLEFQTSRPLPAELYKCDEYTSIFYPRINVAADEADDFSWECRDDLIAAGDGPDLGVAIINERAGNLVALWFPETTLDRLRIMAYLNEYALLHDDIVDAATTGEQFEQGNSTSGILQGFERHHLQSKSKKPLQARIMVGMLEIDEYWGREFLNHWAEFLNIRGPEREEQHKTLEDYVQFRWRDAGVSIYLDMLYFAVQLQLTTTDLEPIRHILLLVGTAMMYSNDSCSWNREYKEYIDRGETGYLVNAVRVVMDIHGVDPTTAKNIVISEMRKTEELYCEARDTYIAEKSPSAEMKRLLSLLEFGIAGNAIWHLTSARYDESQPKPVRKTSVVAKTTSNTSMKTVARGKASGLEVAGTSDAQVPNAQKCSSDVTPRDKSLKKHTFNKSTTIASTSSQCGEDGDKYQSFAICGSPRGANKEQIVLEPYVYVASLPSKGARDELIDALDNWYHVPTHALTTIRSIVATIHNVSLMLDDIEDASPVRRGHPAAHIVFGTSQTINSATFLYAKCLESALNLSKEAVACFSEELCQLHIGQSHDLHWTYHCKVPTEVEYFKQTEQKTGGLFRMASRMMQAEATKFRDLSIDTFMSLLGRYYQVRDDYLDVLSSDESPTEAKYNDLDQGAFTLPLIQALAYQASQGSTELLSVLQSRKQKQTNQISLDAKKLICKRMEEARSLQYTRSVLKDLHAELKKHLEVVEDRTGVKNWVLRLLLHRLKH